MTSIEALDLLCTCLQILGFFFIVLWYVLPRFSGALISVCGFAAVVKVFLPLPYHQDSLAYLVAIAGIGVIIIGCIKAQEK